MNLEVFAYKFFFEFHEEVLAFLRHLAIIRSSSNRLFLCELLLAGPVLVMRPRRKAIVLPMAFAIAIAPTVLRFIVDGPPGVRILDYGRFGALSNLVIALSLFACGILFVTYVLAGRYRAPEFDDIGVMSAGYAVTMVLAVTFVSHGLLAPPQYYDDNPAAFTGWLAAHLVFRSLLALAILCYFNYAGLLRPRLGTALLLLIGGLSTAYAGYQLINGASYFMWRLTVFF